MGPVLLIKHMVGSHHAPQIHPSCGPPPPEKPTIDYIPSRTSESVASSTTIGISNNPCTATTTRLGGRAGAQSPGNNTSSTELGQEYTVLPEDGADDVRTAATLAHISAMGPPARIVYTSALRGYGVIYWIVKLTPTQAIDLLADANVGAVMPSCTKGCHDPWSS